MKLRFIAALVAFLIATPAFPHHSFAAEFDINKPVTVTGTLTRVEWINPHVFLYVDGRQFEMDSPNGLMRRSWNRTSLKIGATITITGYVAKDGSRIGNAKVVRLVDEQPRPTHSCLPRSHSCERPAE